jgi:thiosulfate dehydrogenase
MSIRSWKTVLSSSGGLAAAALALAMGGTAVHQWQSGAAQSAGPLETSRTVWACDRRKMVVVEGVAPDQKLPRAKAQQVADLLMDLMRFCDREVTARVAINERITLSVDGLPFLQYVPGGPLPIELAHNGIDHSRRDQAIWQAELDKLVGEGNRLFHSDELGSNGVACAMCHPNASNTHPETYPKFQTQLKKVVLTRDMVNWCIENPLEGKPLPAGDPRMAALEAYMLAQRTGVPLAIGKH